MKIRWEDFLSVDQTFAITASVSNSEISNSLYALQCLKDGIADYFRDKFGKRPDVETINPDLRINLHIEKGKALISLDTSGESLHKRGYRLLAGEAPMQETLAAALIELSGWSGEEPLMDCMCGSGTILCEALMRYCNIPAQKFRVKFGFFRMPEFDKGRWELLKDFFDKQIRSLPNGLVNGNDRSLEAIKVAKANLSRLPYNDAVNITNKSFQKIDSFENGVLITNPPYGIRLEKDGDIKILYKELGDFLKQKCRGTSAFIFTGQPELRKSIGLKTTRRIPLSNGKLEGVLLQIDSYEGSKKKYYQELKEQGRLWVGDRR
jgi:putative N6-adenine-specific DNA methylase